MFRRMRERREQRERAEAAERLAAEAASLEGQATEMASLVEALSRPESLWDETGGDCPVVTKRGEEVIGVYTGVSLVELRSRKLAYKGASHGLSIRVAKGVYYRPSVHSGAISETVDEWKVLDENGTLVISNQRAVYTGRRFSREFPFSKLLSWGTELDRSSFSTPSYLVTLPVSSRVRTSAVGFPAGGNEQFRDHILCVLQCGIAMFNGTHEDFIHRLESDLEELRSAAKAKSREAAENSLSARGQA